jgi:hypothetical protein
MPASQELYQQAWGAAGGAGSAPECGFSTGPNAWVFSYDFWSQRERLGQ